MKKAGSAIPLIALFLAFSTALADASVIATFTVTRVDDVGLNSPDFDFFSPDIEIYALLSAFGPGESPSFAATHFFSIEQGQSRDLFAQISRVVPDSGAFFLFALFDADPDDDDLIGTHSFFTGTPVTESAIFNNNLFPPGVVFSGSFDDKSSANSFRLSYEVTLEPLVTTAPEPSTIFLLGTGLLGLVGYRRKKQAP